MKVIRSTVVFPTSYETATIVMRQSDAKVPLEEIGEDEEGFVFSEIYEVDDSEDFRKTVIEGAERAARHYDVERNMAIMYYWMIHQYHMFAGGALIFSDIPAPLTVEEIHYVHRKLKRHTGYRNFTFSTFAKDGTPVTTSEKGQTP